jgi:phytoene dehydrogenase-like protein
MAHATDEAGGPREDGYDAVVVGSGLGGVSAAALLSKHGYKTLVLEQGEGAGGLAHAFKRGDYTFDSAIRVLAEGEMVEGLLSYLGVLDECKLLHIDHLYRAKFPGLDIFAPVGLDEFMEAHIRLFPDEAEGIRSFFGIRRQMFLETAQMPMQLDPRQLGNAMELAPTLFKYRTATLGDVLDEHLRDPKLKAMACALWPYMGTDPSRLSFFAYSQFIGVLVDGPYYCEGTFQNLVDAFVTALERNGGELALRTPVTRILVENGRVAGVEIEGRRTIRAPIVVSNADAHHTFDDLIGVDQLPSAFTKKLQRLKPSMSACVLYGATKHDVMQYEPAHETFIYRHWDHADTWRDVLDGKPAGMSMSIMTMLDPSIAPPDEHIIIITAVAPYDIGTSWEEHRDGYMDSLLVEFETVIPNLREHLDFWIGGTPLEIERYTRNFEGATYGWELIPQQIGSKRLGHVGPVGGLYLSGHWTEEGPASFRVILSGINTASQILADSGSADTIPSFKPSDIPGLAL